MNELANSYALYLHFVSLEAANLETNRGCWRFDDFKRKCGSETIKHKNLPAFSMRSKSTGNFEDHVLRLTRIYGQLGKYFGGDRAA